MVENEFPNGNGWIRDKRFVDETLQDLKDAVKELRDMAIEQAAAVSSLKTEMRLRAGLFGAGTAAFVEGIVLLIKYIGGGNK